MEDTGFAKIISLEGRKYFRTFISQSFKFNEKIEVLGRGMENANILIKVYNCLVFNAFLAEFA